MRLSLPSPRKPLLSSAFAIWFRVHSVYPASAHACCDWAQFKPFTLPLTVFHFGFFWVLPAQHRTPKSRFWYGDLVPGASSDKSALTQREVGSKIGHARPRVRPSSTKNLGKGAQLAAATVGLYELRCLVRTLKSEFPTVARRRR